MDFVFRWYKLMLLRDDVAVTPWISFLSFWLTSAASFASVSVISLPNPSRASVSSGIIIITCICIDTGSCICMDTCVVLDRWLVQIFLPLDGFCSLISHLTGHKVIISRLRRKKSDPVCQLGEQLDTSLYFTGRCVANMDRWRNYFEQIFPLLRPCALKQEH